MTDKVSHYLQGGALVATLLLLYYASKNGGAQTAPTINGQTLPQPSQINFGSGASTPIQTSPVNVGGSPFYLTYNYSTPPANNVGVTASNPLSPTQPPSPITAPAKSGCGCGGNCKPSQFTGSSITAAYTGPQVQQGFQNLLSLFSKGA